MMTTNQIILTIAVIAAAVQITRFASFLIFPAGKPTPKYVGYLSKTLPGAAISLLIVFSFKNIGFQTLKDWLPALIASLSVAALHIWKRQMLLSIGAGTVLYMVMVQLWK